MEINKHITKKRFNKKTRSTEFLVGGKMWVSNDTLLRIFSPC